MFQSVPNPSSVGSNKYLLASGRTNIGSVASDVVLNNNTNITIQENSAISTYTLPLTGPNVEKGQPIKANSGYWRSMYYPDRMKTDTIDTVGNVITIPYNAGVTVNPVVCQIDENNYILIRSYYSNEEAEFNIFDMTVVKGVPNLDKLDVEIIKINDFSNSIKGILITNTIYSKTLNRGLVSYIDIISQGCNIMAFSVDVNTGNVTVGQVINNPNVISSYLCSPSPVSALESNSALFLAFSTSSEEGKTSEVSIFNCPDINSITPIDSISTLNATSVTFCSGSIAYLDTEDNRDYYLLCYASGKNLISNIIVYRRDSNLLNYLFPSDKIIIDNKLYNLSEGSGSEGNGPYIKCAIYNRDNPTYRGICTYFKNDNDSIDPNLVTSMLVTFDIDISPSYRDIIYTSEVNTGMEDYIKNISGQIIEPPCIDITSAGNIALSYNKSVTSQDIVVKIYSPDDLGRIHVILQKDLPQYYSDQKFWPLLSAQWLCCNNLSSIETLIVFLGVLKSVSIFSETKTNFISPQFNTIDGIGYIGLAQADAKEGDELTVDLIKTLSSSKTGLYPGKNYYIDGTGKLNQSTGLYSAGIAITENKFIIWKKSNV